MLIDALPLAAAARPPRHRFQEAALDLVERELQKKLAAIKSDIDRLRTKALATVAERKRRVSAVATCAADVDAKIDAHRPAKAAEGPAQREAKVASDAADAARAVQKDGDAVLNTAEEKQHILAATREQIDALEDAEGPADALEAACLAEQLRANLAQVILDTEFVHSAAKTYSKPASARGIFDRVVITHLSEELAKSFTAVQQVIAEGSSGKAARAQTVLECESKLRAAVERQATVERAASSANAAKQIAEAAYKAAKRTLMDHAFEVEFAQVRVDHAEERFAKFQSVTLRAFADLRDPVAAEASAEAKRAAEEEAFDAEAAAAVANAAAST